MRGKTDINQLHINCTNCTTTVGQGNAFGGTFANSHRPVLKPKIAKEPPSNRTKYENESIVNFQIDSDLKFVGTEKLNVYWQEYQKIISLNTTLPKVGSSWLKKIFGSK